MDSFNDEAIQEAIIEVDDGKHAKKDLFLCARPDLLNVKTLASQPTVLDVKEYVDTFVQATSTCDLRAWQSGICNMTMLNHIPHPDKTGFLIESIATETLRRANTAFPNLQVIWCSPYQIAKEATYSIVTVEGLSLKLSREEYIARIDVCSIRQYSNFFQSSITGSFLRQCLILASTTSEKLRFDLFCSIIVNNNAFLQREEQKLMVDPILNGIFGSEKRHIFSLPGKNAVAALISFYAEDPQQSMMEDVGSIYFRTVDTIRKTHFDDPLALQQCFLQLMASVLSNNVLLPKDLSRDAIGFLLLAAEDNLLNDCPETILEALDEIAFEVCTEHDEDLHRSSQECLFRGRSRQPFGHHRWLDNTACTYSIEPTFRPSVTTTCAGKVVRLGIENGIPWMYGLDIQMLLSVFRWGVERAPVLNGSPNDDMVSTRKVRGQSVVSLLFSGRIGARGTAWLMSQIMYGDLKLSRRSRNGFVALLAEYNSASHDEGFRYDTVASPIMISRLNMIVIESDPYLVLGEYEAAKLYRRNGYLRVGQICRPRGHIDAVGRAYVGRPVK